MTTSMARETRRALRVYLDEARAILAHRFVHLRETPSHAKNMRPLSVNHSQARKKVRVVRLTLRYLPTKLHGLTKDSHCTWGSGRLREELLVSQRHHGIDSGRAPHWNEAGPKANRDENSDSDHKRSRIARLKPKK